MLTIKISEEFPRSNIQSRKTNFWGILQLWFVSYSLDMKNQLAIKVKLSYKSSPQTKCFDATAFVPLLSASALDWKTLCLFCGEHLSEKLADNDFFFMTQKSKEKERSETSVAKKEATKRAFKDSPDELLNLQSFENDAITKTILIRSDKY